MGRWSRREIQANGTAILNRVRLQMMQLDHQMRASWKTKRDAIRKARSAVPWCPAADPLTSFLQREKGCDEVPPIGRLKSDGSSPFVGVQTEIHDAATDQSRRSRGRRCWPRRSHEVRFAEWPLGHVECQSIFGRRRRADVDDHLLVLRLWAASFHPGDEKLHLAHRQTDVVTELSVPRDGTPRRHVSEKDFFFDRSCPGPDLLV